MRSASSADARMTPLNVGAIPADWEIASIAEISTGVNNGFVGQCLQHQCGKDDGVLYLQGFNVRPNRIDLTGCTYVTKEFAERQKKSQLREGDILTVQSGHIGTTAIVSRELAGSNCHALIITRPDRNKVFPPFLAGYMNSYIGQARMRGLHVGSSIQHINTSELAEYRVPLPLLEEQVGIAEILLCADAAITNVVSTIDVKRERKRGLMQQLLTGQTRFKMFKGEKWRTPRLGELLKEVDRYVTFDDDHTYRLASIRRRSEGLFFREALQGKDIKTKVMKTIHTGDFVLSKMQVVHGAWGLVTEEFDGMFVSDSYIALVPLDAKKLKIEFLNYLSQTRRLRHLAYLACHGVHIEKMTFNLEDFFHEKITIPPTIEEQAQIVEVLSACDEEIRLLEKQLEALKEQKRGLMQKLLTGEIRVKVPKEN